MQWIDVVTRLREVLSDPLGTRFPDAMLEEAVRQALREVDGTLPRVIEDEMTISSSGRDQPLPGLVDPLYLISLSLPAGDESCALEPEVGFTYRISGGQGVVHFVGGLVPQTGQILKVTYASRHTLNGLDAALVTTLPEALITAVVNGAAGHACLLRAHSLHGVSGVKPGEIGQLLQIAQLRLDLFQKNLNEQKVYQEFGFPPGFALDPWDKNREAF